MIKLLIIKEIEKRLSREKVYYENNKEILQEQA